jgi:hypothetical protein
MKKNAGCHLPATVMHIRLFWCVSSTQVRFLHPLIVTQFFCFAFQDYVPGLQDVALLGKSQG